MLAGRLRGYLTGSLDLVIRTRAGPGADRFLVVDYKTNRLAAGDEELTAWHYRPEALAAEMQRAHYPLQALFYCVALHRYLRWRLPGYDPQAHLGGRPLSLPPRDGWSRDAGGRRYAVRRVCLVDAGAAGDRDIRSVRFGPGAGMTALDRGLANVGLSEWSTDPFGWAYSVAATGALAEFSQAGVLAPSDIHTAARLTRLADDSDPTVALGVAFAVRGPRFGHVYVDLATVRHTATSADEAVDLDALPWPDPVDWTGALAGSSLVAVGEDSQAQRPLRLIGTALYLDRYWRDERAVGDGPRRSGGGDPTAPLTATRWQTGCAGSSPRTAAGSNAGRPPPACCAGWPSSPAALAPGRRRPWPACWRSCASSPTPARPGRRWWLWLLRPARPPPDWRKQYIGRRPPCR